MRKYVFPVLCTALLPTTPAHAADLSAESLSSIAEIGSSTIEVGLDALSSLPTSGTLDGPAGTQAGQLVERKRVGIRSERIRYTSTNERGELVPVTGAFYSNPKPKGLVAMAPGTRGLGDQCAPSAAAGMVSSVGSSESKSPTVNINYETPMVRTLLDAGYSVVVTDYIGLGTPGIHTYLNRVDQGHALIDAARSVATDNQKIAFWGYSQGGGASAAAAELVSEYAPELNVVGTFSGAAPADPAAVMSQGIEWMQGPVIGFAAASYAESYPEFAAAFDEILTDQGRAWLEGLKNACAIDAMGAKVNYRELTKTGQSFAEVVTESPQMRTYLDLNKVGNVPVSAPILVLTNADDDLVPEPQATQLAADYCALGSPVEYRKVVVPGSPTQPLSSGRSTPTTKSPGSNHALPLVLHTAGVIDWLDERFDGKPMRTVCPADAPVYVAQEGLNAVEIASIVLGVLAVLGLAAAAAAPFMPQLPF